MTGRLADLAAVVTGGGSGIGRAIVGAYLAEGATVVAVERSPASAEQLSAEGEGTGDRVRVVVGDASRTEVLREATERAESTGCARGHLTCCVGVFDGFARVTDLSPEALVEAAAELWSTNVVSGLVAVNVAHSWLRRTSGSVTFTLSESAYHVTGGGVLYASTKWALRGVVEHLATELAPDVRVNGVAPGGTTGTSFASTPVPGAPKPARSPAERDAKIAAGNVLGVVPAPQDHAGAYVFLADPVAARVVTGVVVSTDGGRS